MSVNDVGRHAWESFRHGIQIGLVASASVHHSVITFRPEYASLVPARPIRISNRTATTGKEIKSHRLTDLSFKIDRMFSTTHGMLF